MMAKRRKPRHDSCRHGALDLEGIAEGKNPWRVDRRLNSHPVVDDIGQHLDLTEGLKLAAGDAERHHCFSLLRDHGGNDRVQRPLAPGNRIGMAGLEHEAASAVVEDDPGRRADDAAPEVIEDRIDERHGVPIGVNHREKSRVTVIRNGEGRQTIRAPVHRYTFAQLRRALP